MRLGFLITGRLKSTRLPLKILLPLNGRTVIERVIDRAKHVRECQDIILCTSTQNQDLPLVRIAKENDIYCFNGHPDDVLKRLLVAAELFGLDYFIGITADNPLFSIYHANMISDMVRQDHSIDFVYTKGLPIGLNIYAVNVNALKTVCAVKQEIDTEIWGYLINRPEIFNVKEINAGHEFVREKYRLTLDEPDDYYFFKALFNRFAKDDVIDVLDAFDVLDDNSKISSLNSCVIQRDLDEEVKRRIDEFYRKKKEHVLEIKKRFYSNC